MKKLPTAFLQYVILFLCPLISLSDTNETHRIGLDNHKPSCSNEMTQSTNGIPEKVLRAFHWTTDGISWKHELRVTENQLDDSPDWNPLTGKEPPFEVARALQKAYPVASETNMLFELSAISIERIPDSPTKWFYLFTWHAITVSTVEDRPMFVLDTLYTAVLMNGIRLDTVEVKQAESPTMMIPKLDLTRQSVTTSKETR